MNTTMNMAPYLGKIGKVAYGAEMRRVSSGELLWSSGKRLSEISWKVVTPDMDRLGM